MLLACYGETDRPHKAVQAYLLHFLNRPVVILSERIKKLKPNRFDELAEKCLSLIDEDDDSVYLFPYANEIGKVEMAQPSDKQKRLQCGVDKGLIEMFLKMTPEERIQSNDNTIRALVELRNAFKKQKTSSFRSKRSA